jgi:hypothetical protein
MPTTAEVIVYDSILSGTLASYGASAVDRTSEHLAYQTGVRTSFFLKSHRRNSETQITSGPQLYMSVRHQWANSVHCAFIDFFQQLQNAKLVDSTSG